MLFDLDNEAFFVITSYSIHYTKLYELSDKINQKLLDQLYLHSKKSLVVLLILAVILTYFMSSYVPWYIIYPWFIAIQSIVVSRLYDVYDYLSHDCSDNYKKWHQKFAYKAVLSAVLWGIVITSYSIHYTKLYDNKLIILPFAFLLSAFAPWLIIPILMLGGVYLAYEGAEKIIEFFIPHQEGRNNFV